jgi:hypothetical protein
MRPANPPLPRPRRTLLLDERAGHRGTCRIELVRTVGRLADQHEVSVADEVEQHVDARCPILNRRRLCPDQRRVGGTFLIDCGRLIRRP